MHPTLLVLFAVFALQTYANHAVVETMTLNVVEQERAGTTQYWLGGVEVNIDLLSSYVRSFFGSL